jgi:cell division transport system permease protein
LSVLRRLTYFARKALGSVRGAPAISLLTSGTIGATLLMAGLYVLALQNLEGLALIWGRTATLTAYVDDTVPAAERESLRSNLEALPAVETALLVSPHQALERFKARGPAAAALVEGVTEEVLPASVELQLTGGFADLVAVEQLAHQIAEMAGVSGIDYGQREFERLQALIELLRIGGLVAGLLLAVATAFIVSNTIRLTVYARRDEIAILRLVGATAWFVRTPYLFEGILWGAAGGLLAVALLFVAEMTLAPQISVAIADVIGGLNVHLFSTEVAAGILAAGVVLGSVGSAVAVGRFLDVENL